MLISIVQWSVISLILIILLHHIFSFLKDTLTIPKVKDLVKKPTEKYNDINNILKTSTSECDNKLSGSESTKDKISYETSSAVSSETYSDNNLKIGNESEMLG